MKNRINLYHPSLHPQVELLTLTSTVAVWLLCLGVIVTLYAGFSATSYRYEQRLEGLEQQVSNKNLHLDTLKQALATRGQDPALLKQIESLEMEYGDRQRLLMVLTEGEGSQNKGFARLLADLAANHHQQVALTRIASQGNALQFEGQVADPDVLPQWVRGLSKAPYFDGVEFDAARLVRDEEGLQFALTSQQKDIAAEARSE